MYGISTQNNDSGTRKISSPLLCPKWKRFHSPRQTQSKYFSSDCMYLYGSVSNEISWGHLGTKEILTQENLAGDKLWRGICSWVSIFNWFTYV